MRDLFLNRRRILLLALVLGALAAGLMTADCLLGVFRSETGYPIQRRIQYSFTLQNWSFCESGAPGIARLAGNQRFRFKVDGLKVRMYG